MRSATLLPLAFVPLAACATATRSGFRSTPAGLPAANLVAARAAEPAEASFPGPVAPAPRRIDIGTSYTIAKLGLFQPSGDLDDLDEGSAIEVLFGRRLLSFLAVEGSLGYLEADGRRGSREFDLWAVPVFLNARASLPILFFEPYGGIGIGGLYADYKEQGQFDSNDFVLAGSAFVGLEFGLGRLAVGAEYKYLVTEDTKDDFAIEGSVVSLFMSLPF
ncbi:MAG: outer membrane beta-barrel protein [Planctomycetes bacterium]|nr:outer membrane beta-barrel protein [Planctomycetota bacterium]